MLCRLIQPSGLHLCPLSVSIFEGILLIRCSLCLAELLCKILESFTIDTRLHLGISLSDDVKP